VVVASATPARITAAPTGSYQCSASPRTVTPSRVAKIGTTYVTLAETAAPTRAMIR